MDLGIDPGRRPGYAIFNPATGRVEHIALKLVDLPAMRIERIAVEGQYIANPKHRTKRKARPIDVVKLGFTAGWQARGAACQYLGATVYALTPKVWKPLLYDRGDRIDKEVFCNRLYRDLSPTEKRIVDAIPEPRRLDVLDAIGLARCLSMGDFREFKVQYD